MSNKIENGSTSVSEIFNNLTYGELQQYKVGGADNGLIDEADYPKVMAAINRAVNQIQLDLAIHQNSLRVVLIEGVLTYPLHSKHSLITGTDTYKYVDDSASEPFLDDILRIDQVFNQSGVELPINVRNMADTIFVPQHNVIQVPFAIDGEVLGIVYTRLTRPTTVTTAEEAATTYLPLPDYALSALYAYVANVMSAGIPTEQAAAESVVWFQKYESIIGGFKHTPAIPQATQVNTKLDDNGFV